MEIFLNIKNFKKWKWLYVSAAAEYKRRLGFVGLVCPVTFK